MIPIIVLVALSISGLAVILGARAARDRAVVRETMALARAAAEPETSPQQQALQQAVDGLAYEEVTALRIQDSMRDLVPVVSGAASEDAPIQPLLNVLDTLERHSVATAGMEQVLLNALDMPEPVSQLALFWYAGEISGHMSAAAQNILMYVESGHLASDVVDSAVEVVRSVIHENLTQPGQALELLRSVVEGAAHGNALLGVAQRFFNEQSSLEIGVQSLHELVQHISQHAETLAAGHHLLDAAGAAEHVNALDGVHGHFPWVSAVLSAHREMSLLANNTTTAERAIENAGLDLVGSGVGGWGGAHIGAIIGTTVFPGAGAAVGAMVGAVAGAMFLRWRTNAFKARHLRAAEQEYQQALDRWHERSAEAAAVATAHIQRDTIAARERYVAEIGEAPRLDGAITQPLADAALRLRGEALTYTAETRRLLGRADAIARRKRAPEGLAQAVATLGAAMTAAEAGIPAEEEARAQPLQALQRIATLPLPLAANGRRERGLGARLQSSADLLASAAPGYRRGVTQWGHDAAERFKQVSEQLALAARDEIVAFGEVFMPLKNDAEVAYQAVRRERAALNLED